LVEVKWENYQVLDEKIPEIAGMGIMLWPIPIVN
jgi:hypothetical protein